MIGYPTFSPFSPIRGLYAILMTLNARNKSIHFESAYWLPKKVTSEKEKLLALPCLNKTKRHL